MTTASADANMTKVPHNSAPALSADHQDALCRREQRQLPDICVALDSTTLAPLARVRLTDPKSGLDALLSDNGSASPTVGTDGDVYFGVLENPFGSNHRRGWLLHFNGSLSQSKTPGAFGWDDTASLVPAQMVPSYQGASAYLLMAKYNHYLGQGGDGQNKIAILDPNATQTDPVTRRHGDEGSADDPRADTGIRAAASRSGASIPPPWTRSPNPSSRTTRMGSSIGGI